MELGYRKITLGSKWRLGWRGRLGGRLWQWPRWGRKAGKDVFVRVRGG